MSSYTPLGATQILKTIDPTSLIETPKNPQIEGGIYIELSESEIKQLLLIKSVQYGVDYKQIYDTVECESGFNQYAANPHDSDGGSWGLVQINIGKDAHPQITKQQAFDPFFSAEFIASEFAKGNAWKWTCWKNKYGASAVQDTTRERNLVLCVHESVDNSWAEITNIV